MSDPTKIDPKSPEQPYSNSETVDFHNDFSGTEPSEGNLTTSHTALAFPPSAVRDFVIRARGHTVITKVLIANNGMAAVKAIRSIRKWAYETFGDELAIKFTAMCTPEDLAVNAEFIRMADQYVEVPGGSANNNYSNVDLIVDIAERTGVQAVWVGWGFASENPVLADKLGKLPNKVEFIGPPPNAMRSLGDKIASTVVAQSAKVPCVSWTGEGLTTSAKNEQGHIYVPDDLYRKATTIDVDEGVEHANRIGYPVMIKASEGGGGKGIRLVDDPAKFRQSFIQVQREVPGSPIFIMKLVQNSRHLEVQLLADKYGNAIALFGRDCSVQRRHQKIIEEAPITAASPETLAEMEAAAVRLAKLVGYVSAGTVEYLYEPTTKKYFFLELNPRLQVEHPTTEMVSGVNIPAAQLQIAMGIPLSCIKDIRILYGVAVTGTSDIDFEFANPQSQQIQRKPSPKGHVIAARITAENPDAGFKPNSGKVLELNFRSNSNVWGYFSVNASGGVHEYADSQFGHIFSYGETRGDARKNIIMALKELSIRGDFRTTVEFLVKLLEAETFADNIYTTQWLDSLIAKKVATEKPDSILAAIGGAVFKATTTFTKNFDEYKRLLEKGQTPSKILLTTTHKVDFILDNVQYKIAASLIGPERLLLSVNGSKVEVLTKKLADGGLLCLIDGKSHLVYAKEEGHATSMIVDGKSCQLEKENDPTMLRSPSPGKLVRYLVDDGAHVASGEAYAEIEVMKMYMPLLASESGKIKQTKPAGSVLVAGEVVGKLELDDPSRVQRSVVFDGKFPSFGPPEVVGDKLHQRYRKIKRQVEDVIAGYSFHGELSSLVRSLLEILRDRQLAYFEVQEVLSSISSRIPGKLNSSLLAELESFRSGSGDFPAQKLLDLITDARIALSPDEHMPFDGSTAPLQQLIRTYCGGLKKHARDVIVALLETYYSVEIQFDGNRYEDVIFKLREAHKSDLNAAINIALAYARSAGQRTDLILLLLDHVRADNDGEVWKGVYINILKKFAQLVGRSPVSLKARELLIYVQLPTYEERHSETLNILSGAVKKREDDDSFLFRYDALSQLITANYAILDVLPSFFYHEKVGLQSVAFYTYVLHTYQAYTVTSVKHHPKSDPVMFEWEFVLRQPFSETKPTSISKSQKNFSYADLSTYHRRLTVDSKSSRKGIMTAFASVAEIESKLATCISKFGHETESASAARKSVVNVLNIAVKDDQPATPSMEKDEITNARLQAILDSFTALLREYAVRRVTFMIIRENQFPRYFTFKEVTDYKEDTMIRHIEPAMSYQLELQQLDNFDIKPAFVDSRRLHIFHGVGKKNTSDTRFFVRAIVSPGQLSSGVRTHDFLVSEGNRILSDIMDALEIVSAQHPNTDCNHIFINFVPTFDLEPNEVEVSLKEFVDRNGPRLFKLRVTAAEIRFVIQNAATNSIKPLRFFISSVSGYVTRTAVYQEVRDATGMQKFMSLSSPPGPLHNHAVSTPYGIKESIQPKRYRAHLMGTTYIYDFPELFRRTLEKTWIKYQKETGAQLPAVICDETELVLDETSTELVEMVRPAGSNTCGMVAWNMKVYTPEYPEGRHLVVIANDITFQIGSFGTMEDLVFFKASEYARKHGYPRIYISANSGARIGLADEIASCFKIAWNDETNPTKGFQYLYLTEEDYKSIHEEKSNSDSKPSTGLFGKGSENKKIVNCEKLVVEGQTRYKLIDVIGRTHGLGVENLQGSGLIAGETSRAYQDIFTLSLVTCRSVGIGAYLVRLGQRVIQVEYNPIILTGAAALNKVLGREVYTSNLQLGGTQIMHKNGVSHMVAQNDMDGVEQILRWLSYVPKHRDAPLPVLPPADPIDRHIDVQIPTGAYDVRQLLCGKQNEETGEWMSGFFDKGSFMETLSGWAKGIVTGRARLGGIPVGVIAVETRTTETVVWADPANETSTEQTLQEAGQVWFPNSAFKTAQAIQDFNKGEQLPLILFANWRGFSGGQSDMYKEVLKYGAYIVDALRDYKQPVFIYLIGELRGGAWVVVDPTINPDMMEMYAETNSRGGVLEPEGIVEIKFRKPQLLATIERLDPTYKDLKAQLSSKTLEADKRAELQAKFDKREKEFLPAVHQAALTFADLHDKPGRMFAKKVVSRVIEWREAREFFYFRLLRRISEESLIKEIQTSSPETTRAEAKKLIEQWFRDDINMSGEESLSSSPQIDETEDDLFSDADLEVVRWLSMHRPHFEKRLAALKKDMIKKQVATLVDQDPAAAYEGFLGVLKTIDPEKRRMVIEALAAAGLTKN